MNDTHNTSEKVTELAQLPAAEHNSYDTQRFYQEPEKTLSYNDYDFRSAFAKDSARVLHSAALRKLADKTQVVSPGEGNSPRNRLTHSLEVAQIGKSIAGGVGCNRDLVELAGLLHDIGHPPFGHNGERALNEIMLEHGRFEANAQTIRVVTQLEPKIIDERGVSYGLNLTRASLRSCIKYPWTSSYCYSSEELSTHKFGIYECDYSVFEWLQSTEVSLEAKIMDFADDAAYSIHDIEDGVRSGRVDLRVLDSREAVENLVSFYPSPVHSDMMWEAAQRLFAMPIVQDLISYQGSFADQVALKRFTSELVGRFITSAIYNTRKNSVHIPESSPQSGIVFTVPDYIQAEVGVLKKLALGHIMTNTHHLYKQEIDRGVIHNLADEVEKDPEKYLSPPFSSAVKHVSTVTEMKRIVVDFIASLTEKEVYQLAKD